MLSKVLHHEYSKTNFQTFFHCKVLSEFYYAIELLECIPPPTSIYGLRPLLSYLSFSSTTPNLAQFLALWWLWK